MRYLQSLRKSDLEEALLPHSRVSRAQDYSDEKLAEKKRRIARMRAKQIFNWVYQKHVLDWDQMSDLPQALREWGRSELPIYRLEKHWDRQSVDGTHKFLWKLHDGKTIESVIIPAALKEKTWDEMEDRAAAGREVDEDFQSEKWGRLTACISSQVGCAMACKFCLTGIQGLDRSLETHEIVTQVLELRKLVPLTNVVFMGMGEPLHNFDAVAQACEIFLEQDGLNFSKRKVTVSTSGLVPSIEKLGKRVDVSLAVSLNGTTDEQREAIMPVNKKWNIAALLEACRRYPLHGPRKITFEYVMIRDHNDSLEDAERLIGLLRGIPSLVNLIPFNEHPGSEFKRPDDEKVFAFQTFLKKREMMATVRISRGRDILAACGQLRSIFGTARGTEKHRDFSA